MSREPSLTESDGHLVATWPTHRYRFLLAGGRTVDVEATRDDSDLRAAILKHTKAERIEGVAVVLDEQLGLPT